MSTDGSFSNKDGTVGSGVILLDGDGGVIFAAYRKLFHCNETLESELQAMIEGLRMLVKHSNR